MGRPVGVRENPHAWGQLEKYIETIYSAKDDDDDGVKLGARNRTGPSGAHKMVRRKDRHSQQCDCDIFEKSPHQPGPGNILEQVQFRMMNKCSLYRRRTT